MDKLRKSLKRDGDQKKERGKGWSSEKHTRRRKKEGKGIKKGGGETEKRGQTAMPMVIIEG